jgi:cysteine desulfurase
MLQVLRRENYFDNAATTPPDPRVVREMLPYLEQHWGNSSSIHSPGNEAHEAVELARQRIADLLGAEDSSQITFTSGATESNNWVIRSFPNAAVSPFEHSAMFEPARFLGCEILANDGLAVKPPSQDVEMVSMMSVNNEIGAVWDVRELSKPGVILHSDITQAVGKIEVNLSGLDFASLSAHKFYGPKGVGALYSQAAPPPPFMMGGEQEAGYRAGTTNVPAIVGMGAAAAIANDEWAENLARAINLRALILEELKTCPDHSINGGDNVSPYILSVSFESVEGETLVVDMDAQGYAISSGAACSSRSTEPSHVLTALGLPTERLRGTIRISLGKWNTTDSAKGLAATLLGTVERLRKLRTF